MKKISFLVVVSLISMALGAALSCENDEDRLSVVDSKIMELTRIEKNVKIFEPSPLPDIAVLDKHTPQIPQVNVRD